MTTDEAIARIRETLSPGDAYAQLAEEAIELAHAALKLERYVRGTNPPAATTKELTTNLLEEITDLMLVMIVAQVDNYSPEIFAQKLERWVERIDSAKEARNEARATSVHGDA